MGRAEAWGESTPKESEIPVTYVRGWRLDKEPLLAFGVNREIARGGFDFGIVSEVWRPTSFQFARALRKNGVPYMVDTERYSYGMGPVRTLLQRFQDRMVARKMIDNSLGLTCHSTASRDFHIKIGFPPEKVSYLPAGTDTRLFRPLPGSPNDGQVRILSCGRLEPQKGFMTLLRAFAGVRGATLTIKGRGQLLNELMAESVRIRLGTRVTFDEQVVPKHELPAYHNSFDLYVQPSLDEPFGHSVIEATACGLPVIATTAGGLADSVQDGINGLSCRPGDGPSLTRAIQRLVADNELRKKMGRESRRIAEERFDCRLVARQHVDIYQGAVNRMLYRQWTDRISPLSIYDENY